MHLFNYYIYTHVQDMLESGNRYIVDRFIFYYASQSHIISYISDLIDMPECNAFSTFSALCHSLCSPVLILKLIPDTIVNRLVECQWK
jgi:hypothetical protein